LRQFGLIPELLGRLPVLTYLKPLDVKALEMILTVPKNAIIKQYKKLFLLEGTELKITKGALEYIAEKALEYKLGARGLRSICEEIMTDAMYEVPSQKDVKLFEVDLRYVKEKLEKSKLSKLKVAS